MKKSLKIDEFSSAVFDTGRRGNPKVGCDCEQCFGYCMIDGDEATRQILQAAHERSRVAREEGIFNTLMEQTIHA